MKWLALALLVAGAGCSATCVSDTAVDVKSDGGVPPTPDGGYDVQQCSALCRLSISVTSCQRVDDNTVRCHFDDPCP